MLRVLFARSGVVEAGIAVVLMAVFGVLLRRAPTPACPQAVSLAAYATDLAGRTPHQQYNARRAARALEGIVVAPGAVFSFNGTVRGWSADRGFLKAPVSYDGVLIDDYGGGVCQTSTTLYNAALLAGLPILERHAHTFAPGYVPAGRDAAVAYSGIDLRFRNPYRWPITLHAGPEGAMLVCRVIGNHVPIERAALRIGTLDRFAAPPAPVVPGAGVPRSRWHLTGRTGLRVAVYRDFYSGSSPTRQEFVSDNTYRAVSRAQWTAR